MPAYFVTRPLTLRLGAQRLDLDPAGPQGPTPAQVRFGSAEELARVREAASLRYPVAPIDSLVRVVPEAALWAQPGMPLRLGQAAAAGEEASLADQARALRRAHPARRRFRLLLHNAFGANLGDTLIGLTAFRHALAGLTRELPEVVVDVTLPPRVSGELIALLQAEPGISACHPHSLSLAALSRYQGMLDTRGLLRLPRYGQLPMVDWYLWWWGLAPQAIPAAAKRNRLALCPAARRRVAEWLPHQPNSPVVVVNPRASVALRGMPEAATRRLTDALLARWPRARLVVLGQALPDHPRRQCQVAPLDSLATLHALIARAALLIGVDTYTQHVADATDTPAVTLFTTIDPALYPYYPRQTALTLPGARALPAWGMPKLTPDSWARVEPAYQAAWDALAPADVIAAAEERMAHATGELPPDDVEAVTHTATPAPSPDRLAHRPPGERAAPAWSSFIERVMSRLSETLGPGDAALLLGGGAGELALPLAERLGPTGRLVIMEPRRELQQCLVANLVARGLAHVEGHWAMPMSTPATSKSSAPSASPPGLGCHELPHLYADDDHTPIDSANSRVLRPVPGWPVDSLGLDRCQSLVVASPLPWQAALASAAETLRRCRPVLVLGPMPMAPAAACCRWLAARGYRATPMALSEAGWIAVEARPEEDADGTGAGEEGTPA